MRQLIQFILGSVRIVTRGNRSYAMWMIFLFAVLLQGILAYMDQVQHGLIVTNMRDPVSWGFYIGNFTFLVGVAAAAVLLVIPAYVYDWKPIKEVALFGELLAIAAILMCLCFVLVDMGRPDRLWHMLPIIGTINLPSSLLGWDAIVLNGYFLLNLVLATHIVYCAFHGRPYRKSVVRPLVLLSIPMAVGIHTVTAFLYNGMASRPYWNSAILVPRFLASAFCSGPAILLILFQVLRKTTAFRIKDEALHKIAELMAYAMGINLLLLGAEVFKEFYSDTQHVVHIRYLFGFTVHGHESPIAVYAWLSVVLGIVAFVLFLVPSLRRKPLMMNLGCVMIYASVYIEKGIALVIPGYTPDVLGQVYEYVPSHTELRISAGVFAIGFIAFTLTVKVAVAVLFGTLTRQPSSPAGADPALAESPTHP